MSATLRITCASARDRAPFFVLGAMSPAEADAIRRHLATCPNPHPEFEELGSVVPYLADLPDAVEPPAGLRDRIIGAVVDEMRATARDEAAAEHLVTRLAAPEGARQPASGGTAAPAATAGDTVGRPPALAALPSAEPVGAPRARAWSRGPRWLVPALAAAAVVLAVAFGAWNLALQGEASTARSRADTLAALLRAATATGASQVHLEGQGTAAGATGIAVLPASGSGYLAVQGLAPAPSGKTYEAWFIAGNVPRAAGTFEVGADGLAILSGLQPNGPVEILAVTEEQAGGVSAPTGTPIIVGTVGT